MSAQYKSKNREKIVSHLKTTVGSHFTAAQISDHFKSQGTPMGMATIYRQLDKLVEEGAVKKYVVSEGDSACYEFVDKENGCASHYHCKCKKCGRLIHLDCHALEHLREHFMEEHGFELDLGRTVFYGICSECRGEV